jgi:hypothetical protein
MTARFAAVHESGCGTSRHGRWRSRSKQLVVQRTCSRRSHSVDLDPSRSLAAKFTTMANAALAQRYAKAGVLGLRTGATRWREFITLLIL